MKATVSPNGEISIPQKIREKLNLTPGTELDLELQGERVVITKLESKSQDWRTMRGMLRGPQCA